MKKEKGSSLTKELIIEFVCTYGWAILVILVSIGTLAYFGFYSEITYCFKNPDKCVCEEWRYTAILENNKSCTKSRPKIDYEKHPEDYVTEINQVINEEYITNNQTTYRLKNECEKGNPNFISKLINCSKEYTFCDEDTSLINGKTICREKTDVEKLMDRDCDWLKLNIKFCELRDRLCPIGYKKNIFTTYSNLNKAFRNKECAI